MVGKRVKRVYSNSMSVEFHAGCSLGNLTVVFFGARSSFSRSACSAPSDYHSKKITFRTLYRSVLSIRRDFFFEISCVCDAPMTGVRNDLDILIQSTLTNFERGCNPGCASFFQFFRRNTQLNQVFNSVNSNDVAILYQRDRTTSLGLGDNMSNTKSVRTVAGFLNFRRV